MVLYRQGIDEIHVVGRCAEDRKGEGFLQRSGDTVERAGRAVDKFHQAGAVIPHQPFVTGFILTGGEIAERKITLHIVDRHVLIADDLLAIDVFQRLSNRFERGRVAQRVIGHRHRPIGLRRDQFPGPLLEFRIRIVRRLGAQTEQTLQGADAAVYLDIRNLAVADSDDLSRFGNGVRIVTEIEVPLRYQ